MKGECMYQIIHENLFGFGTLFGFVLAFTVVDALRIVLQFSDELHERHNRRKEHNGNNE